MTTLFVVATPIGNLADLSERARQVLVAVPVVFAEDTRRTGILLRHLGTRPRVIAYHRHTSPARLAALLEVLTKSDAALVSDAGTPGVNDPGGLFIARALDRFGSEVRIVPIPGPSAIIAAASISGFPMDAFTFFGFPPHKKGRQTFFNTIAVAEAAVIFYESPHRIQSAVAELAKRCPTRQGVVCRELTKQFETMYRGNVASLAQQIIAEQPRGEYVVVLAPLNFQ